MKIYLIIVLTIVIVTSCILFYNDPGVTFDYSTFKEEKSAWENLNINDYTYDYYSAGFTYEYVKVFIENGEYLQSEPMDGSDLIEFTKTINDLYNEIEDYYLAENNSNDPYSEFHLTGIEIEYNEDYHIMKKVNYYYHIPANMEVDGNFGYSINDFTLSMSF